VIDLHVDLVCEVYVGETIANTQANSLGIDNKWVERENKRIAIGRKGAPFFSSAGGDLVRLDVDVPSVGRRTLGLSEGCADAFAGHIGRATAGLAIRSLASSAED